MNIKEFLNTYYATLLHGSEHTVHNSYIEIYDCLVIGDDFTHNVVINEVLDIHEHCHLSKVIIQNIINIHGSLHIYNNKLLPGSFVGKNMYYGGSFTNAIPVNGYITQSGIIS